jgi:hypothetical protein
MGACIVMRIGHYTRLKGRVTYFRRKVPNFLRARLASTEICYKLGVISSMLAERLGRRLAVEADAFFEHAKTNSMLTSADLTKLIEAALAGWRELDAINAAEEIGRFGHPVLNPKDRATTWAELALAMIAREGTGASAYDAAFVSEMADKAGLKPISDDIALAAGGRALGLGLATHYLQSAVTIAAMHGLGNGRKGLPVQDWQGRLTALEAHLGLGRPRSPGQISSLQNDAAPTMIVPTQVAPVPPTEAPTTTAGSDPASTDALPFSELVEDYLRTRISIGAVK